jgi:hypothetical protein
MMATVDPGRRSLIAAGEDRNYDMLIAHLIEVRGWRPLGSRIATPIEHPVP